MQCQQCGYRLWNLKTRTCPECGTPFKPSDFQFTLNSVQFCCPHCDQAYYGQGPDGHLAPRAFQCVRCGQALDMDEMVLRPAPAITEEQTRVEVNPWVDRRTRGFFMGWLATIGLGMGGPARLIQATPPTSSTLSAFWFVTFTASVLASMSLIPMMAFGLVVSAVGPGRFDAEFLLAMLGSLLGVVVGVVVLIALWGVIAHGLMHLGSRPAHGLGRTLQAIAYGFGVNVPAAVPCLGFYLLPLTLLWWAIDSTVMVMEGQQVSAGRAMLAVLTLPMLVLLVVTGLIVAALVGAFTALNAIGAATTVPMPATYQETAILTQALTAYPAAHGGNWPTHALELTQSGQVQPWDFVASTSATLPEEVPVPGVPGGTLEQMDVMSMSERGQVARQAAQTLPGDVIAHRVGDFVFTYHGIDPQTADGNLWLVVLWPDPDVNDAVAQPVGLVEAGLLDGTVHSFPVTRWPEEVAAQNRLRDAHGLPPLPDPAQVTHGKPAVTAPERIIEPEPGAVQPR